MIDGPVQNKRHLAAFFEEIASASGAGITAVLEKHCHADCSWKFFHPFPDVNGHIAAADHFWSPLKLAFPDYELRPGLLLTGAYEGIEHVSMLGFVMGNHTRPWLGIPASHQLSMLRFGLNAIFRDGKIAHAFVMFDLLDLMGQAGFYPLRPMPGSAEQWPFPPGNEGFSLNEENGEISAQTLITILEMQRGLPAAGKVTDRASAAASHSPHWAQNMNWFGPAGIGSSRGMRGFRDYHGALFLKAFPDRSGIPRDPTGLSDRPGHFCEIAEGRLAMTAGWPGMCATHTGGQWLGLPPTNKKIEMRVADWYRLSRNDKIADNWVLIDIPHILDQMGLDLLDDLRFFAKPETPRLD